jgi:hypothetical protein
MQSNLAALKTAGYACLLMGALAVPASAQQTYSLGTNPQGLLAYGARAARWPS